MSARHALTLTRTLTLALALTLTLTLPLTLTLAQERALGEAVAAEARLQMREEAREI